jgi:hypothetical protein
MLPQARRNACYPHLQEPILKDVKGRCCFPNSPLGSERKKPSEKGLNAGKFNENVEM